MTPSWAQDAFFYHIYPLGFCGAPKHIDFNAGPVPRLEKIYSWLDHIQELGANALYLGPLFESTSHGYDTADYYHVDRRLGTRQTLADLSREIHRRGMRLVLDGVFNHVGRDFWAFRDLLQWREDSAYRGWFHNLDFSRRSPKGDPFSYEGWAGHYSLVKLNLHNSDVRRHLFDAVTMWVEELGIDGLRLDAADVLDHQFLRDLAAHGRALRPDFWLMGEIVHGDYRQIANPTMLDSATNYECYKGLYSSLNDRNYFEIAYALNRQFGPGGIYQGTALYNFADNHDVNRVASNIRNPEHLPLLYALLFTMPGIPSVYYGSEWGVKGERTPYSDEVLRPCLELAQAPSQPYPALSETIARLARVRRETPALRCGSYQQLHAAAEQFAFLRAREDGAAAVAFNAASSPAALELKLEGRNAWLEDALDGARFALQNGAARVEIPAHSARILRWLPG